MIGNETTPARSFSHVPKVFNGGGSFSTFGVRGAGHNRAGLSLKPVINRSRFELYILDKEALESDYVDILPSPVEAYPFLYILAMEIRGCG
jgi:hypothetical protein